MEASQILNLNLERIMTDKERKKRWEGVITNIQSNVMIQLATYRFLTLSQMLQLDVGTTSKSYLRKQLAVLMERKKPLLNRHRFATPELKKGRVESMYFLTKHGVKELVDGLGMSEDAIKRPKKKNMFYKDYWHRRFTIDFEIAVNLWAEKNGVEIEFFDTYFDMTGNNRTGKNLRAKTRIPIGKDEYIIPDASFMLIFPDGNKELFLFEMYNGKDTARVMRQLKKHAQIQFMGSPQAVYKINKSYNTILLFEHESIKDAVIKRLSDPKHEELRGFADYFLLKSLDSISSETLFGAWQSLDGKPMELFDLEVE